MKNAVLITSRGHPEQLTATVLVLARLAKHSEELAFGVRVDVDDGASILGATRLKTEVERRYGAQFELLVGRRPQALGAEINHLVRAIPDAHYYHVLNDDVTALTKDWDEVPLREGKAVSCWDLTLENPGCPDYPVVSRKWLEAVGGDLFTPYFPYWFDDRWLVEVAALVHGGFSGALPMTLYTNKTGTQRLRDFRFWFGYYAALQEERFDSAQRVLEYLSRRSDVREQRAGMLPAIQEWHAHDCADYLRSLNGREAAGDPDPGYLAARVAAEERLRANPLLVEAARAFDIRVDDRLAELAQQDLAAAE